MSSVTLTQLEYLLALRRYGGFGAAAKAKGVAQPAVSYAMAQLESELGVRLVQRSTRGSSLTAEGILFADESEQILRRVDEACTRMRRLVGGRSGQIAVGMTPGLANLLSEPVRQSLSRVVPELRVVFAEGFSGQLRDMLAEERLDCALLYDVAQDDSAIRSRHMAIEPMFFMTGSGFLPFDKAREVIDLQDLQSVELVIPTLPDEMMAQALGAACNRLHLTLNVRYQAQSLSIVKRLLRAAAIGTIFPLGVLIDDVLAGQVNAWQISGTSLARRVCFALPSGRNASPATDSIFNAVNSCAKELLFPCGLWNEDGAESAPVLKAALQMRAASIAA